MHNYSKVSCQHNWKLDIKNDKFHKHITSALSRKYLLKWYLLLSIRYPRRMSLLKGNNVFKCPGLRQTLTPIFYKVLQLMAKDKSSSSYKAVTPPSYLAPSHVLQTSVLQTSINVCCRENLVRKISSCSCFVLKKLANTHTDIRLFDIGRNLNTNLGCEESFLLPLFSRLLS